MDKTYELPICHEVICYGIPVFERNVDELKQFLNDRALEDGLSPIADLNVVNSRVTRGQLTHGYFTFENIFDNLRVVDKTWKNGKVFRGEWLTFKVKDVPTCGIVTIKEIQYLEDFKKRNREENQSRNNNQNSHDTDDEYQPTGYKSINDETDQNDQI